MVFPTVCKIIDETSLTLKKKKNGALFPFKQTLKKKKKQLSNPSIFILTSVRTVRLFYPLEACRSFSAALGNAQESVPFQRGRGLSAISLSIDYSFQMDTI